MAAKENQHFVPQFYLRNFSVNNNQKQIGIYNLPGDKFIPAGPLKSQAYKPYQYGKDGKTENMLSRIEGKLSPLVKKIINEQFFPNKESKERFDLLFFVLLSELRNPTSPDKALQMEENLVQSIKKLPGDSSEYQDITPYEELVANSLNHVKTGMLYTSDLSLKILKNETSIPFICSDNPVVKYNQFLENRKWPGGMTGFGCLGLQLFLPISSKYAIMFYDDWIYKVGNRRDEFVSVDEKDVRQLNLLQGIYCTQNVFFNHEAKQNDIKAIKGSASKFPKPGLVLKEFPKPEENGKLLMQTFTSPKINMELSFVKQTVNAKTHTLDNRAVQLRKIPFGLMQARR